MGNLVCCGSQKQISELKDQEKKIEFELFSVEKVTKANSQNETSPEKSNTSPCKLDDSFKEDKDLNKSLPKIDLVNKFDMEEIKKDEAPTEIETAKKDESFHQKFEPITDFMLFQGEGVNIEQKLRNKYEQEFEFSRKKLLEVFCDFKNGKWESKHDEEKLKVYQQLQGSSFSCQYPLLWFEMHFEIIIDLKTMVNELLCPAARKKWDLQIQLMEEIREENQDPNVLIVRQISRAYFPILDKRESIEKYLGFQHKNKYFIYFSSLPNEIRPIDPDHERSQTIAGIYLFEKRGEGKIVMTGILQRDLSNQANTIPKKVSMESIKDQCKIIKQFHNQFQKHLKKGSTK